MVVFLDFYDHWMLRYSAKRQNGAVPEVQNADLLTFRQLSRHPDVVEA